LVTDEERAEALRGRKGIAPITREKFLRIAAGKGAAAGDTTLGEWPMDGEGIAVLLFTSGTTGAPKAAVLRHKHLVSYILGSVEFGAADENDAALVSVPPYHIAGIAAVLSSVYAGRRIVQLSSFSAEAWLDVARKERVTHAFVVPTMLARIVDALEGKEDAGLGHLRAVAYGGGKMPLPVIEKAMRLFPTTDFTNAYGLTETSSTIAVLGPDDHRAAAASTDAAVRRRLVSVGRALPGVEIEVRDEEGLCVAAGASGEIYVRGEQVSGEYLGRGSTLGADGWFATHDGGSIDGEGYLFIEGRIDDVIVRGGENLSPGEIEEVLLEHAAVADCAVGRHRRRSVGRGRCCGGRGEGGAARCRRSQGMGEGAPALLARARPHRILGRAALQRNRQALAPQDQRGARGATHLRLGGGSSLVSRVPHGLRFACATRSNVCTTPYRSMPSRRSPVPPLSSSISMTPRDSKRLRLRRSRARPHASASCPA
jgi:acyl-CoA synthetase (AMP-forming)/AMP-acid ligase II